jgi:hypothetical protein
MHIAKRSIKIPKYFNLSQILVQSYAFNWIFEEKSVPLPRFLKNNSIK